VLPVGDIRLWKDVTMSEPCFACIMVSIVLQGDKLISVYAKH
jgi:hypothetical protein